MTNRIQLRRLSIKDLVFPVRITISEKDSSEGVHWLLQQIIGSHPDLLPVFFGDFHYHRSYIQNLVDPLMQHPSVSVSTILDAIIVPCLVIMGHRNAIMISLDKWQTSDTQSLIAFPYSLHSDVGTWYGQCPSSHLPSLIKECTAHSLALVAVQGVQGGYLRFTASPV